MPDVLERPAPMTEPRAVGRRWAVVSNRTDSDLEVCETYVAAIHAQEFWQNYRQIPCRIEER